MGVYICVKIILFCSLLFISLLYRRFIIEDIFCLGTFFLWWIFLELYFSISFSFCSSLNFFIFSFLLCSHTLKLSTLLLNSCSSNFFDLCFIFLLFSSYWVWFIVLSFCLFVGLILIFLFLGDNFLTEFF